MNPGDEIAGQATPAEKGAAPRKPWQTPVVILESIDNQTTQVSKTGVDASATPFTAS